MKRIILSLAGLFSMIITAGQNFDNMMSKKQVDCSDIAYNSGLYFIQFVSENKLDSADQILQYWETKCGMREPVHRAKLLLSVKEGRLDESVITQGIFNYLFNYQSRIAMIQYSNYYSYDNYKSYYGYIPPGQEFDQFTRTLAGELKKTCKSGSLEYLLTEFYSDNSDTIFSKLQSEEYRTSSLAMEYRKAVYEYVILPELHMSWITGIWIPTGGMKNLGIHPDLGFQMGSKHRRMNYDVTLTFKFLNSPNDYYARRSSADSLEKTSHFFGGHIGFDLGYDLYTRKQHEIQVTGGVAFEGFDALTEDKDRSLKSASAGTYNINAGVGYRYYLKDNLYLGIRAKYNFVDYTLNHVVDFTGNPITIQFIVGGLNNVHKKMNLNALHYKLRK